MSVKQPKNISIKADNVKVELAWNSAFGRDSTMRFDTAQKFVDRECINLMDKYTPKLNEQLVKSPAIGTKIGSGRIVYASPYARYQYYGKVMVSRITGSAYAKKGESKVLTDKNLKYSAKLARPFWFEVTKKQHGDAILRGAARIAGGKAK